MIAFFAVSSLLLASVFYSLVTLRLLIYGAFFGLVASIAAGRALQSLPFGAARRAAKIDPYAPSGLNNKGQALFFACPLSAYYVFFRTRIRSRTYRPTEYCALLPNSESARTTNL